MLLKPLPKDKGGKLDVGPFMEQVIHERNKIIESSPDFLKNIENWWSTTKPYYVLRKLLDHLGYDVSEEDKNGNVILDLRRESIQYAMVKRICDKSGKKRHELGIMVIGKGQFMFRGESNAIGLFDIDQFKHKGVTIILIEKSNILVRLAPYTKDYGIALVENGGNFVEYVKTLCERAHGLGCNVAILTDFDISGVKMCMQIPYAKRIGVDLKLVRRLNLTSEELRDIEERYNPNPDEIKFVWNAVGYYHGEYVRTGKLYVHEPDIIEPLCGYNISLLEMLNDNAQEAFKYLKTKRIELDHMVDVVGPERFFQCLIDIMLEEFEFQDYNRAIVTHNFVTPSILEEINTLIYERGRSTGEEEAETIRSELSKHKGFIQEIELAEEYNKDRIRTKIEKVDDIVWLLKKFDRLKKQFEKRIQGKIKEAEVE